MMRGYVIRQRQAYLFYRRGASGRYSWVADLADASSFLNYEAAREKQREVSYTVPCMVRPVTFSQPELFLKSEGDLPKRSGSPMGSKKK